MIHIYTTPSCSSCRKAKRWFEDHRIEYREKNIFNIKLTKDDIFLMLKNTESGFDDIISTRSKIFQEQNLDIEDMSMTGLTNFIIANPSVLRRPIIIDDKKMQVGYNEDEIRTFIPKRLREIIMCTTCDKGKDCDYQNALNIYFKELHDKTSSFARN
jgi:regulatory protein spx